MRRHLLLGLAGALGVVALAGAPARASGALATFVARAGAVTSAELRGLWHPGCPVGPAALRSLELSYVGFDGRVHLGTMIVNVAVVADVEAIFRTLYDERFPIAEMVPESAFGGSDPASMAADNTSGFNCRLAVASGPPSLSEHAYGEAIDVNPVQNPYLEGGVVQPRAGAPYLDRSRVRPGMAVAGGELVEAFARVGWYWGGRWTATPDYQHFSLNGR